MEPDNRVDGMLYDGPIGTPWCTEEELRAELKRLKDWLLDRDGFTERGRAQVEQLVAQGEEQLALKDFDGYTRR